MIAGAFQTIAIKLEDQPSVLHDQETADVQVLVPDPLAQAIERARVDPNLCRLCQRQVR